MTATVTGVASSRVLALAATAIALLALAATRIGFASYEFRYSLLVLLAGRV